VTSQPPDLRISDADRERVAEQLRDAAGEGRLTVDELDERLERAYAARTGSDLAPLTADLPAAAPGTELDDRHRGAGKTRRWIVAIMGGGNLRGRWLAGRKLNSIAIMGGGEIDLRNAVLTEGELQITIFSFMGGVNVIVPPGVDVEATGFALMGGNDTHVPPQDLSPGARRVHVRAISIMGGSDVKMRRRDRKALEAAGEPPRTGA
jgi:Domain of unknown function (DUF1707)/Cell wall-active antibiotics response 4TMS YvqF